MSTLTFTIPRNLWISANRSAKNHGHLARVRRDLHELSAGQATVDRIKPMDGPVHVLWTVHYPAGTGWTHGDPTNASTVTKPLLDGMVPRWLPGDGPLIVTRESFERGPNLPKKASLHEIKLTITEVPNART